MGIKEEPSSAAPRQDRRKSHWQEQAEGDFVFVKKVQRPVTPKEEPAKKAPTNEKAKESSSSSKERVSSSTSSSKQPRIEKSINLADLSADVSVSSIISALPPSSREAVVQLPMQDSPAAARNKEMRKRAQPEKRRTSLGNRGRRSSAALNGLCHLPHDNVPAEDFYRHIQEDLSEPQKMKQLLAWCAERTQKAQGSGSKGRDPDLVKAFTAVQDNVIEGIRSGKIDCSWYKRKKDVRDERTVVTKPNPKNIENQQMLAKLDQTLHRLQQEEEMWTKLQRDLCTEHAAVADQFPSVTSSRVVDPALMESQLSQEPDENQRDLLNQLPKAKATVSGKDLRHSLKELGSEVDQMFHDIYKLTVFEDVTRRYNDDLYSKLMKAYDLRNRFAEAAQEPEPMDLLRALSQVPAT